MRKAVQIVCTGVTATDGCGVELTMVERRLYDGRCEHCGLDWDERVRAWRFGSADADLDAHFAEGAHRSAPQTRRARAA